MDICPLFGQITESTTMRSTHMYASGCVDRSVCVFARIEKQKVSDQSNGELMEI